MERPTWAPGEVDLNRPSAARVYDYYLGGAHNFAADREFAHRAMAVMPDIAQVMRTYRAALHRAVWFLLDQGIRQFLDLGSGIPTVGNVHEVAQRVDPAARVVYVDNEPVAVAHSRALLADNPNAAVIGADVRDPAAIFAAPETRRLLDLDRPLGVLMSAVLHFVPDSADPQGLVSQYRERMAPGSYLMISHATNDHDFDQGPRVTQMYRRDSDPVTMRTRAQVSALFEGFELVSPGLVYLPLWRPDALEDVPERPELSRGYVAVGRRI
ncbi:SAM-dependent methyltransferase [Goodfellowiella coeruleoviolacea]|uniref:S-adenosyl methyltransferase n=1 Tax=Goodfellowiella coeruleoviolacea TaxID=334858 RepID=A0AAE3GE88_9PSEU|nr:SAM-dependent methyltransferase [Goodfellowiella coeruleoviolacea]MCP2166143.1 S-adenosyl methyltransferase [Goodfellowiella coeruleoviolacea]